MQIRNQTVSVTLTHQRFWAQRRRWAAEWNEWMVNEQRMNGDTERRRSHQQPGGHVELCGSLPGPLTSKVTLPSGSLSAEMSKNTVGLRLAAAGPLLHRRAAVKPREQNRSLWDRSILRTSRFRSAAAARTRITCREPGSVSLPDRKSLFYTSRESSQNRAQAPKQK